MLHSGQNHLRERAGFFGRMSKGKIEMLIQNVRMQPASAADFTNSNIFAPLRAIKYTFRQRRSERRQNLPDDEKTLVNRSVRVVDLTCGSSPNYHPTAFCLYNSPRINEPASVFRNRSPNGRHAFYTTRTSVSETKNHSGTALCRMCGPGRLFG